MIDPEHPRASFVDWRYAIPYVAMLVGLVALDSGWIAFLLYHGGVIAAMRSTPPRRSAAPASRWAAPSWMIPAAIAFGALGGLLLDLLWPVLVPGDLTRATAAYLAHLGLEGAAFWTFVAYHALVNPVIEERYWRRHLVSARRGIDPGDVAFAGYHLVVLVPLLPVVWLAVVLIVLVAAAWSWRRTAVATGSLTLPIASHLAADAAIMLVLVRRLGGL